MSRLYKAVLGYINGFRKALPHRDDRESERPRFDPKAVRPAEDDERELRLRLEREKALADARIRKEEWNLASEPIERALEESPAVASAQESDKLKAMLHQTREQAAKMPTQTSMRIPPAGNA